MDLLIPLTAHIWCHHGAVVMQLKSLLLFQSISSRGMNQQVTAEKMLALRDRISDMNKRDRVKSNDNTHGLGLGNEF